MNEKKFDRCAILDANGYRTIEELFNDCEPYKVDMTRKAKNDCKSARKYYTKRAINGVNMKDYHMHHTLDCRIVPVLKELHKVSHCGGVYIYKIVRG